MEILLWGLLLVVLPMVIAYRLAPAKGRPQLGFMLLGWLGVVILLCMKDAPKVVAP